MIQDKTQLVRDGLETAYIDGNIASEISYISRALFQIITGKVRKLFQS